MTVFEFTNFAYKQFRKMPAAARERVLMKFKFWKSDQIFFVALRKVNGFETVTHRLRIGSYRLLVNFDHHKNYCSILKIGKRSEIYK